MIEAEDQLSSRIVWATWTGTGLFSAVAVAAVLVDELEPISLALDAMLFAAGVGIFLWALVTAAGRSRTVEMGVGELFLLAGDAAPTRLRRRLLGSLAAQVAVGLATAAAKPFTPLAGGVLVPMFGLALCGLWGAKLGTFRARKGTPGR